MQFDLVELLLFFWKSSKNPNVIKVCLRIHSGMKTTGKN